MNKAQRRLELIKCKIETLPQEQRVAVRKMLKQILDLISKEGDETVASATVQLFNAIASASRADVKQWSKGQRKKKKTKS